MWELGIYGVLIYFGFWCRFILSDFPTLKQYILWFCNRRTINLKEEYGDWVVITGASDGIGKEFAKVYAKRNINVALVGRNNDKLEKVANEIKDLYSVETKIIIADFSKGREIYTDLKKELESFPVGILVNNVGVQYLYPMAIEDLPEQEIWDNINTNIASAVMLTRIVLTQMTARNKGAIVNVSSLSNLQAQPYMNLYAASKSYMSYFSDALRWELKDKKRNITVQTLVPYYISTKINDFQPTLQKISVFIPDTETYVNSAIGTLGNLDHTTGYWSHSLIWFGLNLLPHFVRHQILGERYKSYNEAFLNKSK